MGENSKISWTDNTFNSWWGCSEVSPACKNCYARRDAKRYGKDKYFGLHERRLEMSEKYWAMPLSWDKKAKSQGIRSKVFCGSMCDVFDKLANQSHRNRLWDLIEATPNLFWLLLTKRPYYIKNMIPSSWLNTPPQNVGYGTTVEDQVYADVRIPILLQVPAVLHFISCEPLLGPVDTTRIKRFEYSFSSLAGWHTMNPNNPCKIDWVIAGGESGPGARPVNPDWIRKLRDDCAANDTAFFFKQWGPRNDGHILDGQIHQEFPRLLQ